MKHLSCWGISSHKQLKFTVQFPPVSLNSLMWPLCFLRFPAWTLQLCLYSIFHIRQSLWLTLHPGNVMKCAYIKDVYHLWAQTRFDTFHQLIIEALRLQPLHKAVTWSKLRAVRRVVKQLPAETLRQCSSMSSLCAHMLSWRSTTPNVNIPHLLLYMTIRSFFPVFHNIFLKLLWPLLARIPSLGLIWPQLSGTQSLFELLLFVRWMHAHSLLQLHFGFNSHKWNPALIASHLYDTTEKLITIFVSSL
jgi:hypothetical protein